MNCSNDNYTNFDNTDVYEIRVNILSKLFLKSVVSPPFRLQFCCALGLIVFFKSIKYFPPSN